MLKDFLNYLFYDKNVIIFIFDVFKMAYKNWIS